MEYLLANYARIHDIDEVALMFAAECKSEYTVSTLIDRGADIEIAAKEGPTVLHVAAWAGSGEIVSLLLSAGADVKRLDSKGYTPELHALEVGRESVVQNLIGAQFSSR